MGAHIPYPALEAFVLAALFAGVGGALWGHFITVFSPKAFYLQGDLPDPQHAGDRRANTVTGAVVGTFVVTLAYEGLRGFEGALNEAKIMARPVVGLTEIVLALSMIAVLALGRAACSQRARVGAMLQAPQEEQEKPG